MTSHEYGTMANLVIGDGADELRQAMEQARQSPGRPVTVGQVTVTWTGGPDDDYSTFSQVIKFEGDPEEPVAWG